MQTFLVLLCILFSSIQQISRKEYNRRYSEGVFTFSFGGVFVTLLYFMVISGGTFSLPSELLVYVISFSLCYTAAYFFTMLAIEIGPLSLTSLIISYSLIIPALYGIAALGEPIRISLIVGIVLLFLSLILVECANQKSKKPISFKWLLYVLITFFTNGICTTVQKVFQFTYGGAYGNDLMLVSTAITAVIFLAAAVICDKKSAVGYLRKGAPWFSLCGLGNGAANQLTMILAVHLPASFLYPVLSAGGILLTAAVSLLIYREKLSAYQKAGLFTGILAIVFLNV